jgi:hypothetical protein
MSAILDFIMGQVVQDLDEVFAKDKGSAQDMSSDSAKARQNGKVGEQR